MAPVMYRDYRVMGMGGAFTAVADDRNLLFYNPAGFASLGLKQTSRVKAFINPAEYPARSVATTGTHDTETLAIWWQGADRNERQAALTVAATAWRDQQPPDLESATLPPAVRDALLEAMFASGSDLLPLPFQAVVGWVSLVNGLLGLVLLAGMALVLYRRFIRKDPQLRTTPIDNTFVILLTLIALSGILLETLRLLADKLVELQIVESVSHETVRQALKKTNCSLGVG